MKTYARGNRLLTLAAALVAGTVLLGGCEQEGPLEKAGEKADEAVNDAKRAVKDAAD